jgi:GNAT superfamily N-acetyltransferase
VAITVQAPNVDELGPVVAALASWQREGGPVQLHLGADAVASTLWVWRRDEEIVAIGFVDRAVTGDEAVVCRMGVAPSAAHDDDVAHALVQDLGDPASGVLPAGNATVEARFGEAFRSLLEARGWTPDEPWTSLHRVLAEPVPRSVLRVETVGPDHVEDRVAVQRAAFPRSTFTADRWHTMAAGLPYRQARCLVGYDDDAAAVATVTVWSAGPGRPGLLEPMGVHRDHRGRGHGTAITLAAAAALREMGSSSATVATPAANLAGVATYVAAGFDADPEVTDFRRPD